MAEAFSIICLSPQDWRVDLPTNRQQIMLRAARGGHEVLFVETGYFLGRHFWSLLRGPDRRSLARRLFSTEKVAPGVRLRKALNVLPWGLKYGLHQQSELRDYREIRPARRRRPPEAGRALDLRSSRVPDGGIVRGGVRRLRLRGRLHRTDHLAAGPCARRCLRSDSSRRAQLVFATSTTMYERQRSVNAETHLVPNVGDFEHFVGASDRSVAASEVADLPRPVLGFAGNFLVSKVDFDLLERVAQVRGDWTLLLVGPSTSETERLLERLARRSNVRWIGPKPYSELPKLRRCVRCRADPLCIERLHAQLLSLEALRVPRRRKACRGEWASGAGGDGTGRRARRRRTGLRGRDQRGARAPQRRGQDSADGPGLTQQLGNAGGKAAGARSARAPSPWALA